MTDLETGDRMQRLEAHVSDLAEKVDTKLGSALDTHIAIAETIAKLDIAQTEATWKEWYVANRHEILCLAGILVVLLGLTLLRK